MKAIVNGVFLTPQQELRKMALLFDSKFIGFIPESELTDQETIDAHGRYVAPGLIDIHIHGYMDQDISDGSEQGARIMAKNILANGVTSFLPTTMTVSWPDIERAFDVVRNLMPQSMEEEFPGAQILGCHAEGPFINPLRKGAQSAENIIPPNAQLILPHQDVVRIITMAPELDGGLEFIKEITSQSNIVVSIGHSNASFEEAKKAIAAGASHITHLFNAQTGLNHREPGIVGAALSSKVTTELIADAFHVHPGLFHLLYTIKKDLLVLITDCTRAGGLPDGEYTLGGQPIFVKGIECRLSDGTIAGSVLRLNDAVANLHRLGGVSLRDAVHAASLSAARCIGEDARKGSIEDGKDADFIFIDEDCRVFTTYVNGILKYSKEK